MNEMKRSWKMVVFLSVFLCSVSLFAAEPDGNDVIVASDSNNVIAAGSDINKVKAVDSNSKDIIDVLKVAGNVSVSSNKVLTKVRTRVGDIIDQDRSNEDCKRIAELPGVEYSYYNTAVVEGRLELTYVVVEQNIARQLNFIGNNKLKEKVLKRKLDFKVGDYVDSVKVEKGADDLTEFYHKKGYSFAEVTFDKDKLSSGKVNYTIIEGPRARVVSVKVVGNKSIKTGKVKGPLKTKTKKFFIFNNYYDDEEISGDVTKLEKMYSRRGFLDTKIEKEISFNETKTKVYVVFNIAEGQVYNLASLKFSGNKYFDEKILREGFKLEEGEMYSEYKSQFDVKSVLAHYKAIGFVDATVEEKRGFLPGNRVDVEFEVTEGERYRLGLVEVSGNEDTQDKVVRQILDEYDFVPGNWYNADKAAGTGKSFLEKRIQQRSMAESVIITPVDGIEGYKNAKVDVTESQTGSIVVGAGVSSNSGAMGQLVYQQRNFDSSDKPENWGEFLTGKAYKGAGQNLRIALEPGTEESQYSVSFTEPYFLDKTISLDMVGSAWEREQECYDEERIKGYLGFEKRYMNDWRTHIAFRAEQVDVTNLDSDAPKEVYKDKGRSMLGGVRFGVGKDTTDDDWNPSKGYIFDVSYEQVGGDYTFGVVRGTYRQYKTIFEDLDERKTVWGIRLEADSIVGGEAPVFEKFYAGGQGSIRGFDYRGVSPRGLRTNNGAAYDGADRHDPIGSEWMVLANTEVTVPIFNENFALMLFVDSGMVEEGGYRVAVGTGIQIMLPQWFGPVPMRFAIATPVMKDDDDDTQIFSFSVGRLF